MSTQSPPDEEVLRKFYRSFHKHGPGSWAKVAKDAKLSVEQCEALHKQHMSFLSLRSNQALEAAFVALVNDHYNATTKAQLEEGQNDEAAHSGRANAKGTGQEEEQDAHVATSSQKPKRTPKPTPQRLAAEEEAAARRLARSNQGTPKSARALQRGPPSPSAGDWPSSQRKRNRRLFEDNGDADIPRYRSPTADRWRGRHNTDVDEGVDALLSLASGTHAASTNLEERPDGRSDERPDTAAAAGDVDGDADGQDVGPMQGTPKRARGPRGGRSTPTHAGTPVRNGARAPVAAAGSDSIPVPSITGLRSPRSRVGTAAAAAAAAAAAGITTSGRGGSAAAGRSRKDQPPSPTTSSQLDEGADGASAAAGADASDAGPGAPSPSDGGAGTTAGEGAAGRSDAAEATAASPGPVNAAGRPVRRRKPSALAIAAAAAVDDDESGSKSARGEVAAMAAALGAPAGLPADTLAFAPAAEAPPGSMGEGTSGNGQAMDMATSSLLAGVPPVKTRVASRASSGGPGSRRAAERPPSAEPIPEVTTETDAISAEAAPGPALAVEAGAGLAAEMDAGPSQVLQQAPMPAARPRSLHPPPPRARRRKSLPERLPPMWEPLPVPPRAQGVGGGGVPSRRSSAGADAAAAVDGSAAGPSAAAPQAAEPAAAPLSTAKVEVEDGAAASAAMPALEAALRHCLGPRMRRWCMYEFMYSAIDRPWFMRNELLEFCVHLQLPTTKLTRLEWSVLRGALGRPRRLSLAFLREERLRLEGYREHARLKYDEVAHGFEVPPELPRQLRVGQEVTARHPRSQQLHDGVILTVKGSKYRVQFHRGDLMTEVIRDTDVMPLDPHECMPTAVVVHPMLLNGRPYDPIRLAEVRGLVPAPIMRPPGLAGRPLGSWATGLDTQMMREQDSLMVQEVQRALEVKEGLVARLTQLNTEAAAGLHAADDGGTRSEHFQLQYTNVVLQLKEINAILEAALTQLQARQQQVLNGSGAAVFGPALALQQQQLLAGGLGTGLAVRPGAPLPQAQTPPAPAALTQPVPVPSPAVQSPVVAPGQQPQGRGVTVMPPLSQAPLIIPPARPSAAPASTGAPPAQAGEAPQGTSSEQLVEQAIAEARAVVDTCRGKTTEPIAAAVASVIPVVAPIGAIQAQPPNGGAVPLVPPPSTALPQQRGEAAATEQAEAAGSNMAAAAGPHTEAPATCVQEPGPAAVEPQGPPVQAKAEDGALAEPPGAVAVIAVEAQAQSTALGPLGRPLTEEELSESWLRDVIVGCVGVLFTIQKCTAGHVPAGTVAEALDLAVQQLQIKTEGENEGLYRDIVQSVQGLKGYLTRALA